ncbi:phosphatidylinositol-3,5-bisphosphate 3-phosphatase MTMR3 isoform X2 [Brachyhypopomus gauderio]|uniref:phosphatidylinositol-3,5-bisphosphate 3-phosphatase MTMR3 isoform X2 n=1 Tax=Brachyhypopomus gauderio TaxID=698409 RepID=UPI004041C12C
MFNFGDPFNWRRNSKNALTSEVEIQLRSLVLSGPRPPLFPGAMGEEEQTSVDSGSPVLEEDGVQVPFPVLHGECVEFLGKAEGAVIALSSYRLHIKFKDSVINVPLQLIESVECRDLVQLHLTCKDCKVIRCQFSTSEQAQDWQRRVSAVARPPVRLEELFAFAFHACAAGGQGLHEDICHAGEHVRSRFKGEVHRMGFDSQSAWRTSNINDNFRLCASYPERLLVPSWITDEELENVSTFRSWKRIPAVVYRHQSTGAVIGRCGQPEVSWWGWRNADDERLVQAIAKACAMDTAVVKTLSNGSCVYLHPKNSHNGSDPEITNSNEEVEPTDTPLQKLLILDARSYAAAVANRAKGGGCECPEYYPNCEVMFMGMANIHSIRRSFQCLRALCAQGPDPANWLSALEGTKWLQHLSLLLKAALLVVTAVDRDHRPVLVHCSDGWDRTPQIVALSKLLLDPYYRTMEGFQLLVETEWLDFGHKFADRCGHGENAEDVNERCPVFLQWLDCVHQLQRQFPCSFQFNEAFLVKLVQHTYSCLFGTFLCNSSREREERRVVEKTCSAWSLLQPANRAFQNILYSPHSETVLHPVCHVRNLMLWSAVYLPNSAPSLPCEESCASYSMPLASPEDVPSGRLPRTRSYDNLPTACEGMSSLPTNRRCSESNLNEKRDDHLQSVEITVAVEANGDLPKSNMANHNTQHPEIGTALDRMLQEEGLLYGVEYIDSKTFNESGSANEVRTEDDGGWAASLSTFDSAHKAGTTPPVSESPNTVPEQNHSVRALGVEEALDLSTEESFTSISSSPIQLGYLSNGHGAVEDISAEEPSSPAHSPNLCLSSSAPPDFKSTPQSSTETLTEECPLQSQTLGSPTPPNPDGPGPRQPNPSPLLLPSQCALRPVSPQPAGHEGSVCNGEAPRVNGLGSWTPHSRRASVMSGGSPTSPHQAPPGCSGRGPSASAHLEEDGLSVHSDAVQVRLRQMEAGHQLQVETLRRQVHALWSQLHVSGELTPVTDQENNVEAACLARCSTELYSQNSWDQEEQHDKQETAWYRDHLSIRCYRCENKFWLAARKHQCRNCGNVFCASCCDQKVAAASQHLYEPNRACQACYGHLRPAELELEKPITASSN